MLGICSSGPRPVPATCTIASNRSRRTSRGAVSLREASSRPRYCSSRSALKPKKSRSEEHTSELQSQSNLVCRLLLEKKNRLTKQFYARSEDDTPGLQLQA